MINGLPERLRKMREGFSLSQRDVANLLNLSPSLISGYETGERTPSVEVLLQLSNLFKCSTDYLLGKNTNDLRISISLDNMTPSQIRILNALIDEFQSLT